ncbi:MAG: murein biosynthesis integral membrane protein MurJ [Anaerolineales bacterium]
MRLNFFSRLSFLTRTSLLLGFFFALDKVLAFLRSMLIARTFGLSFELDAFNVANNLPDLLFALISGGALAMAFIPLLSEKLTLQGQAAAWDLFSRVANLAFTVTAALAVLIALFAPQIVRSELGIAPGFGPEQQHLIVSLMRLNLIATLIFSLSGLVMAALQAHQHFLTPALAPNLYNLGQIFGALFLAKRFGVHGLVYGVILGAVLHLGVQLPALFRYRFRWTPSLRPDPSVLEALRIFAPRLLTMFLVQLMFIARDNLASRFPQVGAISALTYGWMIMQVPETLLGTALATALLPTLSEYAARRAWDEFRWVVDQALAILIALTMPAAAILSVILPPLLRFAFGFDAGGTSLLTWTTRAYLLTLCGYALQEVLARAFYARKEPWLPLYGVLLRLGIYLVAAVVILRFFAAFGAPLLALAEIALTFEALFLLLLLRKHLPAPPRPAVPLPSPLPSAFWRGLLAAAVGGGVAWLAFHLPILPLFQAFSAGFFGLLFSLPFLRHELRLALRL